MYNLTNLQCKMQGFKDMEGEKVWGGKREKQYETALVNFSSLPVSPIN